MARQFKHSWSAVFHKSVDRRLTRRVQVQLPVSVQGHGLGRDSFCDDARTVSINADGGQIFMLMPVHPGQRLLVTNHGNEQTEEAVVVWAKAKSPSGMNIGFRFSSAAPQFWANLEIGPAKNRRV